MYPLILHKNLTAEKWANFTTAQQILMIANEVNRLSNGIKSKQNIKTLRDCMERAFELIDLTISYSKKNLRKELLRWRDLFAQNYIAKEMKNPRNLYEILLTLTKGTGI